ncbi:fucolectin-like [Paramisgurnus dabryanus]|uniref:fucolectin-like n=1 Tax=Paramisgurnus dabryanus TaxID=90735 RepID=UPI003CCFAD5D
MLSPWWKLDLLNYYEISTVVITARSDAYFDQTNRAEIRIGNSTVNNGNNNPICAVTSGFQRGQTISYSCGVMVGRYINVVMTGRTSHLALCEVEVYDTENVALDSAAIQSSTYYPFVAQNVIDGVRYGPGEAAYCAVTAYQSDPWLSLDLQYKYEISTVIITARSDCCAAQTNGAEIRIGNSTENYGNNNPKCAVTSGFQVGQTISYSCNGMEGRYVNVVMTGLPSNLSLCEVEVYGKQKALWGDDSEALNFRFMSVFRL